MIFMFFKPQNQTQQPQPQIPTPSNNISSVQTNNSANMLPFKQKIVNSQHLQGTNLIQQHYKWTLQHPMDQSDPTIAMHLNIGPIPNQKKRFLDFQSLSTYVLNYGGTDFPTGVSLCCMELAGIMNENQQSTTVVATALPLQISTVLNAGGIIGYNVIYKNDTSIIWDITGLLSLTFKIKLFGDTQYRPLPSAQPIQVIAKISRVVY